MKKRLLIKGFCRLFLFVFAFILIGCEEESAPPVSEDNPSTLNDLSIPGADQEWGFIDEYFFDLESGFSIKYNRYDFSNFSTDILFNSDEDTLRFESFNEFEVVTAADAEDYSFQFLDDDSTFVVENIRDSIQINSTTYQDVDSLVWNQGQEFEHSLQYYSKKMSDYTYDSLIIDSAYITEYINSYPDSIENIELLNNIRYDNFDSLIFTTSIDSVHVYGTVYIDTTTFVSNESIFMNDPIVYNYIFSLSGSRIPNSAYVLRKNTDCNDDSTLTDTDEIYDDDGYCIVDSVGCELIGADNNAFDFQDLNNNDLHDTIEPSEPFTDRGNGILDPKEPGKENGVEGWTSESVFFDRNCNSEWDIAEVEVSTDSDCPAGTQFILYEDGGFCDKGNGKYDYAETGTDLNGNGEYTSDEIFETINLMSTILVDYTNPLAPEVLTTILPGDSLIDRWRNVHLNLIEDYENEPDNVTRYLEDIDRVEVVWSNPLIEFFEDESEDVNFSIAKSTWADQYDYHLYGEDGSGNITKLIYPSFFEPYGYWFPEQIDDIYTFENNLLFSDQLTSEISIYAYDDNGIYKLRDGEHVFHDTTVATILGTYHIETDYYVERDAVSLPMSTDSTETTTIPIDECFKVTKLTTTTLIGNGVQFVEENISWLAKGFGVVKDQIEFQWLGMEKRGLFRLEMVDFLNEGEETLSRINNYQLQSIKIDEFDKIDEFNNDPFIKTRTGLMQRVQY